MHGLFDVWAFSERDFRAGSGWLSALSLGGTAHCGWANIISIFGALFHSMQGKIVETVVIYMGYENANDLSKVILRGNNLMYS